MTRGTAFLLLKNKVLTSTEFNGDMYPEGHGREFLKMLSKVETTQQFLYMLKVFNGQEFQYKNQLLYHAPLIFKQTKKGKIDFAYKYFDIFFSDWCFFKNMTGKDITFLCSTGEKGDIGGEILLRPKKTVAVNFGQEEGHYFAK